MCYNRSETLLLHGNWGEKEQMFFLVREPGQGRGVSMGGKTALEKSY